MATVTPFFNYRPNIERIPLGIVNIKRSEDKVIIINDADKYFEIYHFLTTSQTEAALKATLFSELYSVYEECKEDGWDYDGKTKAKGISEAYLNQAKTFISHVKNEMPAPMVVPYYDGKIGLEWITDNSLVYVVFCKNDKLEDSFMFSVISPDESIYGTKKQTVENQRELINTVMRVFRDVK